MTYDKNYDAGVYVDPLSDWGWKTLFGSERYKEHLISFINAVYPELRVIDITYQNNEDIGDSAKSRSSRFDLICYTNNGETVMVEVQKAEQRFFFERGVWTSSFKIRDQAPQGKWNYHLKGVYSIGIINFAPEILEGYSWDDDSYIHSFSIREDKDHQRMTERIRFTYIAVRKFNKKSNELNNNLEKWVYLLQNLKRLDNKPKELQDRIFERFFKAAEIAQMTTEQQDYYRESLMNENDWLNAIDHAEYKGELKGVAKGREEGREEGTIAVATNLLAMGMPVADISKATGLSEDRILALK